MGGEIPEDAGGAGEEADGQRSAGEEAEKENGELPTSKSPAPWNPLEDDAPVPTPRKSASRAPLTLCLSPSNESTDSAFSGKTRCIVNWEGRTFRGIYVKNDRTRLLRQSTVTHIYLEDYGETRIFTPRRVKMEGSVQFAK